MIQRVICFSGFFCILAGAALALEPLLQYQGRLTDLASGEPVDGPAQMTFALYAQDEGGAALWTETTTVNVIDGLFSTILGDAEPLDMTLFDGQDLWLGVALGAEAEMTPRQRLVPGAYALHANNAATLEGFVASDFAQADDVYTQTEVDDVLALKADADAVNDALALKADAANVYTQTEVDDALALKADADAVNDALALKADAANVYTQTEVDDALALKAGLAEIIPRVGEAYIVVETTADAVQNAANLLAAYAQAAALEPHGQPLTETNRAVVIVPPGRYDLGAGQLVMNADFVDLVGLSTAPESQYIFGTSNGPGTGVLRQTADDVRIENLFVHCTRDSGGAAFNDTAPAAYFPNGNLPNTVVRNCRFLADDANARSMRFGIEYSGTYEDCTGGAGAFGGGAAGIASGTFINCTGGASAFGGGAGTASGTFTNCTGGDNAFGGGAATGTASGTFTNCTGGNNAFGGFNGTANGVFTNCTAGNNAFGGGAGTASGTFTNCTGGFNAFGGGNNGLASGEFTNCTGGDFAFGGGTGSTASGEFTNCTGGNRAFGGNGTASGTFTNCTAGTNAFGAIGSAAGGTFLYCVGGADSFTTNGAPLVLYSVRNNVAYP